MSRPKFPSTPEGYALWKQQSIKDVHVRPFAYTFKNIERKYIREQEQPKADRAREVQKFVYDTLKKELGVTFSGNIQSGVVDVLVNMMRESIKDASVNDENLRCHTNVVSALFQNPGDEKERYRLVGDVLVTTGSGPVFVIETATRHSLPAIKEKVKKWFMLPSIVGVLLVQLNESNGYWKPTSRPPKDDVFLINSWAWLNYIEDINEGIDLFDCSKPVTFGGHVWLGSVKCELELYERDFSTKSSQCSVKRRYEFVVAGSELSLEATEERDAFQESFLQTWKKAVDGDSLERFRPLNFDWNELAERVAKTRLQLAYERYKAWFSKYSKNSTSSLGKRQRDDGDSQEVFL